LKKLAPKRPRQAVGASSSAPQEDPVVAPVVPGLRGIPSDAHLLLVDGTFQQVIPPRFVSF
ncbi:hypothetical protein, partial [Klebsiella pneumoniae]|uniref:hypothetical protein n=1 Tax=Klebsiella pneumoniae TaxID=573 RepID=UPI0024DE0EB8